MLILAGIGIGAIAGEGGLLSKAQQGAEEYNQAARNEANTVNDLLNILNGGEPETPVIDAEGNVQFTYNPSTPTNGNVTVGITTETEYDIQYRIGDTEGEFEAYTGEITVDENTAIYVKLANSKGQTGGVATGNVQNIDKVAPVISTATASTIWGTSNSVTMIATDSGSTGTAASNIGIIGYGINQSSTTEPTFTNCTTTSLETEITGITANGTYYVWVKDRAGNTANKEVIVNKVDTTVPTIATIASSNLDMTSFTLTASGADSQSGVASYKFYINGNLYSTQDTTAETSSINVTVEPTTYVYDCYVIVTDGVGRTKQSETIEAKPIVTLYGQEVKYSPVNGATDNWKVFYADKNNIYLISSEYVENQFIPNAENGTEIDRNRNYNIYFKEMVESGGYTGYGDIVLEGERVTRWISNLESWDNGLDNTKIVAYLLDTELWSSFKDIDGHADFAIRRGTSRVVSGFG